MCFPKGLEVQRLGEWGAYACVSSLHLFLLMDVESWMKSLAESGLGFDFFRPPSCFEIWLLQTAFTASGPGSWWLPGSHTARGPGGSPWPQPQQRQPSAPHSMPLLLWGLSKAFPGIALPLAFVFSPPHLTGARCRYSGMVFLEVALIVPSPAFPQLGRMHGRSVRNEAAFICNLPPALSWVPFFHTEA